MKFFRIGMLMEFFITHWHGDQCMDKRAIQSDSRVMLDESYVAGLISALVCFGAGADWYSLVSISEKENGELTSEYAEYMMNKYFKGKFKDEYKVLPENSITIY